MASGALKTHAPFHPGPLSVLPAPAECLLWARFCPRLGGEGHSLRQLQSQASPARLRYPRGLGTGQEVCPVPVMQPRARGPRGAAAALLWGVPLLQDEPQASGFTRPSAPKGPLIDSLEHGQTEKNKGPPIHGCSSRILWVLSEDPPSVISDPAASRQPPSSCPLGLAWLLTRAQSSSPPGSPPCLPHPGQAPPLGTHAWSL